MIKINIDKLIRSRRKTISLVVTQDARLVIHAPLTTPIEYLHELIFKKRLWIKKKQEVAREMYKSHPPKEFVNGEAFLFLGNVYRLQIVDDGMDIELGNNLKFPRQLMPHAKRFLVEWYKERALIKIIERVDWYVNLTGLQHKSVKITDAKKRLGSCGINGTLNFSWRLIMAPLSIVDYVITHELSHLEYRNHSKKFWNRVKTILPDYEQRIKWLKENSHLLTL